MISDELYISQTGDSRTLSWLEQDSWPQYSRAFHVNNFLKSLRFRFLPVCSLQQCHIKILEIPRINTLIQHIPKNGNLKSCQNIFKKLSQYQSTKSKLLLFNSSKI